MSPAAAPAGTTSTSSSRRSRSSRPSTATSRCPPCWPGSTPRTTGQGARRRDADLRRLRQAADRPPRQGARVGPGVHRRGVRDPIPLQPVAHACGPPRRRCSRRRCAVTSATCPLCRATTRRRSTPTARAPAPTTRRRSSGWATSRSPARPTGSACRRTSGDDRATPLRALAVPRGGPRPARGVGRAARAGAGSTSPPRATPTPTTPWTRRAPGPSPVPEREAPCGSTPPSAFATADPAADDDELDLVRGPRGGRLGPELERLLAEARRETVDRSSRCPLPQPLSATALARLRDDPEAFAARAGPADAAPALRRRPGSAPASTPGWSRAWASPTCSTPTSCPVGPTPEIDSYADLAA